ncbi:uncharacterized protein A4U43_C08F28960 [Asparagus officinalis]|nr:uncharacterized protein A4U43_C08F28960 [Asparagus officinalis]
MCSEQPDQYALSAAGRGSRRNGVRMFGEERTSIWWKGKSSASANRGSKPAEATMEAMKKMVHERKQRESREGDGDASDQRDDEANPDHGMEKAHQEPKHLLQSHWTHLVSSLFQPRIIACGNRVAGFTMAVRFLVGPAVMAAASFAIGLRGVLLHVAIVQAALPQGIVPFVFAKEYNVHPDILSTGVIFGMLIALPITLVYYIMLGL